MPHDPDSGQTFGEWLRGGEPLGSGSTVHIISGDPTWATRDQVREGRTGDGGRFQRTRDQLGNDVTLETTPKGRERKHVKINLR